MGPDQEMVDVGGAEVSVQGQEIIKTGEYEMTRKEPKTTLRGRDAKTGEFTTVEEARRHPNDHVVERVPKPGYGDTKKN